MTTTYKPYPAYKDSGVEWLGEIPIDWNLSKIKNIALIFGRIGFRGYTTADIVDEGEGAIVLSPSNINEQGFTLAKKSFLSWRKYFESPEIIVQDNDVLLVKTGSTFGKSTIVKNIKEPMTINPQMALLKHSKIDPRYLAYQLNAHHLKAIINISNTGSGMPTMTQESINNFPIFCPSLNMDIKIANFLDHETARIDTLIAKQKKLIALLKEKRQAVISHAVTKGLNPDVEMKDSGVEWLGEVPAHWEVKRLKYIGKAIIGLTYSPDDVVDEKEGTLVLRSSNIQNKNLAFKDNVFVNKSIPEKLKTKLGDILICSRNGSRNLIGKNAIIDESAEGITFGAFMTVFRSEYNKYLFQVFNSSLFDYQSGTFLTSTVNQLTTGNLNSFEVPFPSDKEKKEISHYLEFETTRIDGLIEKAKEAITLMQERRTALISAAVTGKIDLRDWQAPQEQSAKGLVGQDA